MSEREELTFVVDRKCKACKGSGCVPIRVLVKTEGVIGHKTGGYTTIRSLCDCVGSEIDDDDAVDEDLRALEMEDLLTEVAVVAVALGWDIPKLQDRLYGHFEAAAKDAARETAQAERESTQGPPKPGVCSVENVEYLSNLRPCEQRTLRRACDICDSCYEELLEVFCPRCKPLFDDLSVTNARHLMNIVKKLTPAEKKSIMVFFGTSRTTRSGTEIGLITNRLAPGESGLLCDFFRARGREA